VMYLRLVALVALFSRALTALLIVPFAVLAAVACAAGWLWSRVPEVASEPVQHDFEPTNPLELRVAFLFALLFLAMLVATKLALVYLGKAGLYTLAALMGVTDVTPFIMGITQSAGAETSLPVAAAGIVISAASSNVVKGIYAYFLADRRAGIQSLFLLAALAVLGLVPLLWMMR
jgi:uncharacterized membrane protein (DUF4010 family)